MDTVRLGAINLTSFILIALSVRNTNDVRVVIYSFIFSILARFLMVEVLLSWYKAGETKITALLTSPPPQEGEPLPFSGMGIVMDSSIDYFVSTAVFGVLTFTFVNDMNFSHQTILMEMKWSLLYVGIFLVKDLFSRSIEIDFSKSRKENLAYNSQSVQALFLACGAGIFIYAMAWKETPHPSFWLACGPFLVVKHLVDLFMDIMRSNRRREILAKWWEAQD